MTEEADKEKIKGALATMERVFLKIVRSEPVNRSEDPVTGLTFNIKVKMEIDRETKTLFVHDP